MDANLESLRREFQSRLSAFVRHRVADEQTASDILQLAYLRMHKSLSAGAVPEQPQAWVFALTRHALADYHRSERAHENRKAALELEGQLPADDVEIDPEVSVELAHCIEPLLRSLPAPYRRALELTALQGLSQEQAAEEEGVSLSGMKSRVQRGRKKLRDVLEDCCAIEVDTRGRPMSFEPPPNCGCGPDE